ncbi:hypothetical protein GMRT_14971 [Giardia muris]|uniref:Rab-GAP TBC domain-containing protein n=1 Tax=Giardia muris TaxID=5742 RepID=A0A4Z1STJ5_GIAMU|nr:hypothetical protein GMRT_14971 [Giardia muris]|eukprot:TNJ29204.1 hypothetical protein GMRT_14971 [Giardia muris]
MDVLRDPALSPDTWAPFYSEVSQPPPSPLQGPVTTTATPQVVNEIQTAHNEFRRFIAFKLRDVCNTAGIQQMATPLKPGQLKPDNSLLPYGAREVARFLAHLGASLQQKLVISTLSFPALSTGFPLLANNKYTDPILLQQHFAEMSPALRQVGLDDRLVAPFAAISHSFFTKNSDRVVEIARRGIHDADRPAAWSLLLGVQTTTQNKPARKSSTGGSRKKPPSQVINPATDTLTFIDILVLSDIAETASDEHHFIFQAALTRLLPQFINTPISLPRDAYLYERIAVRDTDGTMIPASGILPFRGLSLYLAPFLFLYDEEDALIHARACYTKYFYRLHTLDGLAPLVGLAELLVAEACPDIITRFKTLQAVDPDAGLLSILVPWLMSGFAGYLMPREYFQLWDRILGYDCLELLSVFAAALIIFKARTTIHLTDGKDVQYYMHDLSGTLVVPLLQMALFDV